MLLGHSLARSKHIAIISLIEPLDANAARQLQEEQAFVRSLTFEELYIEVAQAASALKKLGVKQGDRVAAVSSNNAGKSTSIARTRPLCRFQLIPPHGHQQKQSF